MRFARGCAAARSIEVTSQRRRVRAERGTGRCWRWCTGSREIENATQLAIKAGDIEAVARALQDLESERVEIERRIDAARPIVVDIDALRGRVERYAADLRGAFDRAPGAGRTVLERLLAGRRIAVHADSQRGFRVEGAFDLTLEMTSARFREETGRLVSVVAGARSVQTPRAASRSPGPPDRAHRIAAPHRHRRAQTTLEARGRCAASDGWRR